MPPCRGCGGGGGSPVFIFISVTLKGAKISLDARPAARCLGLWAGRCGAVFKKRVGLRGLGGGGFGGLRDTDVIARLGGDEFGVLQIGTKSSPDPATLARRVREAMTSPCELDGQSIPIDVTIGISVAPNDGHDPELLLKKAEMANQGAKSEQRGSVRFFKPEMDARAKARHATELDLRKALARGEFELYYQPLMNLQRQEISSCEALLRWHHPV